MSEEKNTDAKEAPPTPVDDLVTTKHSIAVKSGELSYTATAGRVVLKEEVFDKDGVFEGHKPKAEVFLTAYTLDGADPKQRPVTFAFNGGPGSASVWLHMGLLGPRRVISGDVGAIAKPPYEIADNAESLLAVSDLVFIDPVSTGYSRAAEGQKAGDFHGFQRDIESIAEIIRLWTSRHGRWMSPKYLCGESYGTLRAAGLADHLQSRYGMFLNGLMLVSSVLDFATLEFNEGHDLGYQLYLPTYAAIAHYHGKHGDRPLEDVLAEAEEFASRDYPYALARGNRLPDDERAATIAKLARLTGLSEEYVDAVDLRIEHIRFFSELLRSERKVVGRLDGRFTGWDKDYGREEMSADPSMDAIQGSYSSVLNHYLHAELEYHNDLPYSVFAWNALEKWSYKEFEGKHVTTAGKLASAMRANPHLKVHIAFGHYDGATPYFAAEHLIAHLQIPRELTGNIKSAYYPAGHMMYVHEPSRIQQSEDLANFVRNSSNR